MHAQTASYDDWLTSGDPANEPGAALAEEIQVVLDEIDDYTGKAFRAMESGQLSAAADHIRALADWLRDIDFEEDV